VTRLMRCDPRHSLSRPRAVGTPADRHLPIRWPTAAKCTLRWVLAASKVCAFVLGVAANTSYGQSAAATASTAQPNGFVVQLPNKKVVSRRSGLRLEFDTRWVNNYGYRPIRVRVKSPKPTTADHLITIRLYAGSSDWRAGSTGVEQDFNMPMGSTSAETVIDCPQYYSGHRYWWDAWVDGVKDDDLSVNMYTAWQFTAANPGNPTSTNLKFLMLSSSQHGYQVFNPRANLFEALGLELGDLPERWIDYTSFDVISLTPAELIAVASKRPKAFEAISRWVRSGGQLWVGDAGPDWERLGGVERLLGMEAGNSDDISQRGWKPVEFRSRRGRNRSKTFIHLPTGASRVVRDPAVMAQLERDADWTVAQDARPRNDDAADRGKRPADSSEWFVQRRFGFGTVRGFRGVEVPAEIELMLMGFGVSPPDSSRPPTSLQIAMNTMRSWESRHGMRPEAANLDFANFLVPGVGQAPVTEFRVLITLFVLAIGPANYWLLKRTNRLHLLVLTVPLLAAVLTVGLFGYALLSDGLGTLVRVRSVTTLDQRTGDAVCWARLSYYAGLAPSRGLVMPDDVAVYPILSGWNEGADPSRFDVARMMEWQPAAAGAAGEQRLSQGWLRSRTPTQFLTVRARRSPYRLSLAPAEDRLTAKNELGTAIHYVAASDEQGNFFVGQDIGEHATQELQSATQLDVLKKLRPLVVENEPEMPAALVEESTALVEMQRQQRRWYLNRYGMDYSTERLAGNLLSDSVTELVGIGGGPALDLPPRSYVAITETGPEVAIGVPSAKLEASFHVVLGKW
jgi:hypothetical protein